MDRARDIEAWGFCEPLKHAFKLLEVYEALSVEVECCKKLNQLVIVQVTTSSFKCVFEFIGADEAVSVNVKVGKRSPDVFVVEYALEIEGGEEEVCILDLALAKVVVCTDDFCLGFTLDLPVG